MVLRIDFDGLRSLEGRKIFRSVSDFEVEESKVGGLM